MPYKDLAKRKDYQEKYRKEKREQIKERRKESDRKYYDRNKEQIKEKSKEYRDAKTKNAVYSITSGRIIDQHKWNLWCDVIKNNKKHPYSDDFTNDIIFEMMTRGCYYCGDVSTTIDRLNSELDHTPENCVGCCGPCNMSKGAADPSTFIRKSYFKARGKYFDNIVDVWHNNKTKPNMRDYKKRAKKQGVPFELSKEKFEELIVDDCTYCHRSSTTWFGIDRIVPSLGYVIDNVVTSCYDCNLDKYIHDIETTMERNERIATRVNDGILIIQDYPQVILHQGTNNKSKKVCAYGNVYASQSEVARALDTCYSYVCECFRNGRYPDDIFEITDEFYEFAVMNNLKNITKKMYMYYSLECNN